MLREKARIDRPQDQSRDQERRQWSRILQLIERELQEGEYLGEPFRAPIGIIIPIEVQRAHEETA